MSKSKNDRKKQKQDKAKKNLAKKNEIMKHDRYNMYHSYLDELISRFKTTHPQFSDIKREGKNPFKEIVAVHDSYNKPMAEGDVVTKILSKEYALYKDDIPTVFPQSPMLMKQLYKANFSIKGNIDISFPFEQFSIAMPKGIEVGGHEMPGITVISGSKRKMGIQMVNEFMSELSKPNNNPKNELYCADKDRFLTEEEITEGKTIAILFKSPASGTHIMETIDANCFGLLLKSKNIAEFNKLLELNDYETDYRTKVNQPTNDENVKINDLIVFSAFKMAATLSVYLSSSNDRLKEGLPSKYEQVNKLNNDHMKPKAPMFLSSPEVQLDNSQKNDVKSHYRSMYFRNLSHPKYYQGEHKDKAVGSRWVKVSDTIVNQKLDAYTATDNEANTP